MPYVDFRLFRVSSSCLISSSATCADLSAQHAPQPALLKGLLHAENDELLIAGLKMIIMSTYGTIIAMFTTKSGFGSCEFKSGYPNVEI